MRRYLLPLAALCALLAAGCTTSPPPAVAMPSAPVGMPQEVDKVPIAPDTPQRVAQLPRTVIDYDHALLTDDERRVVAKLIDASKQIDELFLRQVSEDNPSMRDRLAKQAAAPQATPLDRAGYDYFIINQGPWDRLKDDEPFAGTARKPAGAAFYPADMTKAELEQYVASHPKKKDELEGLFTIVRRDGTDFVGVPYHAYYLDFLDALGGPPVHLVGHSLGGWIAAEIAVRNASRLKSLTLIAPAGVRVKGMICGDNFIWSREEYARNLFYDQALAEKELARVPTDDEADIDLANRYMAAKLGWEPRWFNPALEGWLHRIRIPTLILWGRDDKLFPSAYARAWADRIPDVRVEIIPECGHRPQIEKPELAAQKVLAFIGGQK